MLKSATSAAQGLQQEELRSKVDAACEQEDAAHDRARLQRVDLNPSPVGSQQNLSGVRTTLR